VICRPSSRHQGPKGHQQVHDLVPVFGFAKSQSRASLTALQKP
jgi:hypothetical protein